MSKSRNRNSLLSSHGRASYSNTAKDELLSMKYQMEKPSIPLYPLNALELPEFNSDQNNKHQMEFTYPDYKPWKDHTHLPEDQMEKENQKLNNAAYLNKGYFEAPSVSNEYYSARNLIQAAIFSSTDNCNNVLIELSQHLANAYNTRNEVINKIKYNSNNFRIPPRVTLTASKKEVWLKELANPDIPLSKIAGKLPHGIRNKVLIDALCNKNVPINRAIWFTKCVLFGELIALRKKHQTRTSVNSPIPYPTDISTVEKFEIHWLQEWTQQVVDYIYKFSKEMLNINVPDKKLNYMNKLNYLLTYTQILYVECLLDKTFFLSSFLKFLNEGLPLESEHISELLALSRLEGDDNSTKNWLMEIDINYGQRLVSMTLIKIFWKDILKLDYLCKELSETLLLNYFFIQRISCYVLKPSHNHNHKAALPQRLKSNILDLISDTVIYLFKYNTNVFIIPNYWILISESLYKILLGEGSNFVDVKEQEEIQKQLELIAYRNESLMLNMRHVQQTPVANVNTPNQRSSTRRGSVFLNHSSSGLQSSYSPSTTAQPLEILENDHTFINRSAGDVLRIINQLDRLKLNDELAELLKPNSQLTSSATDTWRINLKLVIYWCITSYRESRPSSEGILIVCNFLKRKVLQSLNSKSANNLKAEFENEILEIIYNLADNNDSEIVNYNLYVLINELYQLKVITISSYLRKLIASGIFYLSPGADLSYNSSVKVHLSILQNLPILNNKQCDSILRKWTSEGFNFKEKFDTGKEILQIELIDRLINNKFDENFKCKLAYFKDLKVGLKFLLINWVTNELKTSITESPKLIHINPSIITNLYNFYSLCDNLTVFFKVLIKFILKNEGKIIICYMDSLYLIGKLIIKHFKLVKFIAGNTYESASTGIELFKLIILNYKDLSTRDFDYFNFKEIWNFIDTVVEKNYSDKSRHGSQDLSIKQKNILLKEQLDSPMELNSPMKIISQENKNNDKYSALDFRIDLDLLLESPIQFMDNNEIKEAIERLQLDVDLNNFLDISMLKDSLIVQLNYFFNHIGTMPEDEEILLIRLLFHSQKILNNDELNLFYDQILDFIIRLIKENEDIEKVAFFIKKLLSYEICKICDLISVLQHNISDESYQDKINYFIYDIIFDDPENEKFKLFNYQFLILDSAREFYHIKYTSSCFLIILKSLKTNETSIFHSFLMKKYKYQVLKFLNQNIIMQTKFVMDELINKLSIDDIILLLNELLHRPSSNQIMSAQDLIKFASTVNEFNLPIYQILVKVIMLSKLVSLNCCGLTKEVENILNPLLDNLKFQFGSHNSYFGELFNYLNWEHKVKILNILENMFLKQTEFRSHNSTYEIIYLRRNNGMTNVLPILKDYFKKFSASSINIVTSSTKFFQDLSKFLLKLLHLVNVDGLVDANKDIYNTISIFLRILIIHKVTLTSIVLTEDGEQFTFVKNLISLLNSKFLSKNEKLKILLYDLLLLMKSSVTSEVTMNTELSEGTLLNISIQQNSPTLADDQAKESNVAPQDYANEGPITTSAQISSIFSLPEPNKTNPLKEYIDDNRFQCPIMLDEDELHQGGDIHSINDTNLMLVPSKRESVVSLPNNFGLLGSANLNFASKEFKLKSLEILEDTSSSLNGGCINLSLFDSYTTKENPP